MRESLTLYDPEERGVELLKPEAFVGREPADGAKEPNHMRNTLNTEEELFEIISRYSAEYEKYAPEIVEHEEFDCDDADIVVVSHGVVSRAAKEAVQELRSAGLKVGYFRPITLRPFPDEQ